jgi:small subunit ribosomal protein S8
VKSERGHPELEIALKYFDGASAIRELKRVSTPGRRVYSGVQDIPQVRQGLGIAIVSTPRGVMSDAQARTDNVGGEVLCTVF